MQAEGSERFPVGGQIEAVPRLPLALSAAAPPPDIEHLPSPPRVNVCDLGADGVSGVRRRVEVASDMVVAQGGFDFSKRFMTIASIREEHSDTRRQLDRLRQATDAVGEVTVPMRGEERRGGRRANV